MEDIKIVDAFGNEENVDKSAFELCQEDKKITDLKFQTKATTFAKDALRRFCKNRSSLVAGVIIGILFLLAVFVPILSPYDLTTPHLHEAKLRPKLFEAGTGWWDGTVNYSHIIYNPKTDSPADFKKNAVVKYTNKVDQYLDDFSEFAYGGIMIFSANKGKMTEGTYKYDFYKSATSIDYTKTNDVSFTVKFADSTDVKDTDYLGEYRIVLQNKSSYSQYVVLKDWSTDYSDFTYNISDYLTANGINKYSGFVRFDVKNTVVDGKNPTLYIDSFEYSTTSTDESLVDLLDTISITDANATQCLGTKEVGYWHSTGFTSLIKTHVTYCDFVYDPYEAQLGSIEGFEIGKSIVEQYIANGWCNYDFTVGVSSFEKLSDKCPIDEVVEQKEATINGKTVINLSCNVTMYKYLGYSSMPKFFMGTDTSGFDLWTRAFSSLRTSFLMATVIAVVCFIIGLVWGAVSGYFGGTVDLMMERFCEILGGMPYICYMTLIMIKWGRTIPVFAFASCITGWMGTAGLTRTQFYRFKGREYILSSRTLGASDGRLIFKHILPNGLGTIVTSSVLRIPGIIMGEATLSYLGLGLQGVQSFGVMLSDNQQYINSYPYMILFPAFIISLLMITFNLFGNGLRDALNPSLKGSE